MFSPWQQINDTRFEHSKYDRFRENLSSNTLTTLDGGTSRKSLRRKFAHYSEVSNISRSLRKLRKNIVQLTPLFSHCHSIFALFFDLCPFSPDIFIFFNFRTRRPLCIVFFFLLTWLLFWPVSLIFVHFYSNWSIFADFR